MPIPCCGAEPTFRGPLIHLSHCQFAPVASTAADGTEEHSDDE